VALCLGSLPILFSNKDLRITDLTYVYSSRFSAFSNHLFEVDSFADLGSLGGGFLGLFFVLLLGSMWGGIGDAIFFALLLLFSLILLLYQPILSFVAKSKAKAKEIISYSSPNEKKKKSRRERREEEKARRISEALGTADPYSQGGFQSANSMADRSQNDFASIRQAEDRVGITREQERSAVQESYVPKAEAPVKPEESYLPRPSYMPKTDTGCFSRAARSADASTTEMPNAYTEEGPYAESDKAALRSFIPSSPRPAEDKPAMDSIPVPSSQQEEPIPEREETFGRCGREASGFFFPVLLLPLPANAKKKPMISFFRIPPTRISPLPLLLLPRRKSGRVRRQSRRKSMPLTSGRRPKKSFSRQEQRKHSRSRRRQALCSLSPSVQGNTIMPFLGRTLLTEIHDDKYKVNQEAGFEKAKIISKVFGEFNFPAKVVSITVGASVTRLNVKTEPGVRVDKLSSLGEEIQIALRGDKSVRIETVVEGKDTSGIELKNEAPMAVSFYSAYKDIEKDTKEKLLLPIGKDISGNMITFPLDDMPHLLIAGTTGSGKSVLVHCMIMTLIMRNYPSELKLMLIDPKQVEFAKYNMEPHLYCPVISDSQSAINGLEKLCGEMDRRYTLFRQNGVVKMSEYNARRAGNESRMEALPNVVCVIDEFADLMQTGGDAVASSVQRLCQKARACGIYLIIATQRPSKDVIPMVIKANIACRIALSCSSQVDSRVILDENGARNPGRKRRPPSSNAREESL
jgi:DNA segregation ATPase FtsK/SpoIIIE-like protein